MGGGQEPCDPIPTQPSPLASERHSSGADLAPRRVAKASISHLKSLRKKKERQPLTPGESTVLQTASALHSMEPRESHSEHLGHHFQRRNRCGAEVRGRDSLGTHSHLSAEVEGEGTHYRRS